MKQEEEEEEDHPCFVVSGTETHTHIMTTYPFSLFAFLLSVRKI
jgi:hypothetical protein